MKPTITSRRPAATSASRMRLARLPGRGQRLLAEDLLARRDAGQHELLVGGAPGSDDNSVDLRVVDQILAGLVQSSPAQTVRDGLRTFQIRVGDRGDACSREDMGEPADVVLADHPDADDADIDCHDKVLPERVSAVVVGQRRTGPRPASDEVAGGTGGDGERHVRLDGVEVLLDHAEDVACPVRRALPAAGACRARRTAVPPWRRASRLRTGAASPGAPARGPPGRPA